MTIDKAGWKTEERGGVSYVTLPKKQLDDILDQMEELADLAAVRRWREGVEETIPADVVYACLDAPHDGRRIAALRKWRRLTRDQLAERIGVTGASITMIETGKRHGSPRTFKAIAAALSVPVDMLLGIPS